MNKLTLLFFLFLIISYSNLLKSDEVKIITKIDNEIITNIDIEKEYKYLISLNKDYQKLEKDKIYKFVKSSLLVGPEGGFSSEENDMLKTYKYVFPISFGKTILRSDTAAIVGLSYLNIINSNYKIN